MEQIIRKISCNEQLYLDMQDLMSNFSIQFIMEYEGSIDKKILEDAVNYVLENTNDNNLFLNKGEWNKVKEKVKVNEITIDSKNLIEDDFFRNKIDYKTHSLEVYLLTHFERKYIVFKLLHSTSDGKGALSLLENVFKKIKNEELRKFDNSKNEQELAKDICLYNKNVKIFPKYKMNFKINQVKNYTTSWKVISINGYKIGIISKIAKVLAKYFKNNDVNFMIPVDIRRHLDNNNYLGNMTLPIFLNAKKDEEWQEINGKLLSQLKDKKELNKKSLEYFGYMKMPYSLRKDILKMLMSYLDMNKSFSMGGIISYLGRIDADKYSTNDFKIIDFISLPLQQPGAPFSMVISEMNNKTNISISTYKEQIEDDKFNEIVKDIEQTLNYEVYQKINKNEQHIINDCLDEICKEIKNNKNEIAVDDYCNQYTYNELDYISNYIMDEMRKNEVKPKDTVVIYMKRSFEFICSVLACLKMNVCFIPVDESTNKDRITDIINDSKCKLILLDDLDVETDVYKLKVDVKELDQNYLNSFENIEYEEHSKDDIAYKIYTSGTTGKPKGIEISYNNLSNYLTWTKEAYITNKNVVMPLFTSLSVDLTITSYFLPLICGGKIKVFKENFSLATIKKIIEDPEISIIKATPSHLSLIDKNIESNIEKIVVGGENFTTILCESLFNYFNKNVVIYNEYGPTETTVGCAYSLYKNNKFTNVPIGISINNTKMLLINENGVITEENVEGEIYVSGDGVSQGLINKNSETLEKIDNEIFYKTGDIGFIKDSVLHCIGRKNNQIKIRGNRVELDEINVNIMSRDDVTSAYSIFTDNSIYTFVCDKNDINVEEVMEYLKKKLPVYMIPSKIIQIEKLPIKSSGKLDEEYLKNLIKNDNKYDANVISKIILDDKNIEYDNYTIEEFSIDSLEVLKLMQILCDELQYNETEFYDELFKNIVTMKVSALREYINKRRKI